MKSWSTSLRSVTLIVAISYASVGMGAVDLTGNWYAAVGTNATSLIHFVQTGTSLTETTSGATGTIDPDTGAFTLTFPFSSPINCGAMIEGQADGAGNTFTATGVSATTDPDCHSIFCACGVSVPITTLGSRSPCGNGVVDPGEACDGGNLGRPGDCCLLDCSGPAQAAGAACTSDGSVCSADVCDAGGACTHIAGNAGGVCRPALDACDVEETCDGIGPACPADAKQPDGTDCSDGLFCTGVETGCQVGVCQTTGAPCAFCDEIADECVADCAATPQSCRAAENSRLLVKGTGAGDRDKLVWKWLRGAPTSQVEFSDPTTGTDYALCIYAGTAQSLITGYVIPGDSQKWGALGSSGYTYRDPTAAADGITKVKLAGSTENKSKVLIKGKGTGLPDLPLPLDPPLVVQLMNGDSGLCWGASFDTENVSVNDGTRLKAKFP